MKLSKPAILVVAGFFVRRVVTIDDLSFNYFPFISIHSHTKCI